jgi:LCP family protein required for cell wall assembly
MNSFDLRQIPKPEPIKLPKEKKKFKWHWWEIVIIVLLAFFVVETIYFYGVLAKTKKNVFQPAASSIGLVANIGLPKSSVVDSSSIYKNYTTFLLMGDGGDGHPGALLTDSIQVLVLNNQTKQLKIISIPRDLYLQLDQCGMGKINQMYECGESIWGSGSGGDFSKSIVSQVLGMPINYYVKMDFTGFVNLVDVLGGVDIQNAETINDSVTGLNIKPGNYHMDGNLALEYARSRETTNDFDRSGRQQKIILAIKDKVFSSAIYLNSVKLYQILNILSNHLTTDLGSTQAFSYLKNAENDKNAGTYVIDNSKDNLLYSTTSSAGAYILLPTAGNFSAIQIKVKQIILGQ